MLHVMLCGFVTVKDGAPGVAMSNVRFVCRFRVIFPVNLLGRLVVMLSGPLMVFRRSGMVLRDVEVAERCGLWRLRRGHAEVFVTLLRFVSVPDCL